MINGIIISDRFRNISHQNVAQGNTTKEIRKMSEGMPSNKGSHICRQVYMYLHGETSKAD